MIHDQEDKHFFGICEFQGPRCNTETRTKNTKVLDFASTRPFHSKSVMTLGNIDKSFKLTLVEWQNYKFEKTWLCNLAAVL